MIVKGIITFSYKYIATKYFTKLGKCVKVHTITTDDEKEMKLSRSKNND